MTHRTLEQIGADYSRLMKRGAELQYRLYLMQQEFNEQSSPIETELLETNEELRLINQEAHALKKSEEAVQGETGNA